MRKTDVSRLPLSELLRRKEIVEWQINIAKCHKVIERKQAELAELNKYIGKYNNRKTNF